MADSDLDDDGGRKWLYALFALFIAGCLVAAFLIWSARPDDTSADGASNTSEGPVVSGTASETAPPEEHNHGEERESLDVGPVIQVLAAFVEAYHLIQPGDTTDSRLQRFEDAGLPVAPGLLSELDFTIPSGLAIEQEQSGNPLAVTAILGDGYEVTDVYGDGSLLYVIAPVEVSMASPDGQVVDSDHLTTASTWMYQDDGWILTEYTTAH